MERNHGRKTGAISGHLSGVVADTIHHNILRSDNGSKENMKVSEDFSQIYFFRSPMLYFRYDHIFPFNMLISQYF